MPTSTLSSTAFISQQMVIYIGIFFFIIGVIGGPLVLIVFLSLRTFRQSSCAFYLIIMSFVDTLHLFTGLFTFIMINGFGIDWTDISLFYCKFRPFYVQLCVLMSYTCICLATIDQFLATCSHPRWHQWNNIKLARYILIGAVIIWSLHGIPFILYHNHTESPVTDTMNCVITNIGFSKYYCIFYLPILKSFIPVIIMILFGILAYRNVQNIAYRTVPLVRRELDKQLTVMVLVHNFCDVLAVTPIIIQGILTAIIGTPNNLDITTELTSINNITTTLYYFHFVVCINYVKLSF